MNDLQYFAILLFGITLISLFSFLEVVIMMISAPNSLRYLQQTSLPIVVITALFGSIAIVDTMHSKLKKILNIK